MAADPQHRSLDFLETRERFLSIKADAILRKILATSQCSEERRGQFCMFLEMVRARFHFEFVDEIQTLKRLYDPFDPTATPQLLDELTEAQREGAFVELRRRYEALLRKSNYVKLTRELFLPGSM